MKIGYARVSTGEQTLDLQVDALRKAGCERVFTDTVSGAIDQRAGLDSALAFARSGDTISVWRLDRLGRSVRHLVSLLNNLGEKGVQLQSLHEAVDTSSPSGKLFFHVTASLAEFEKDLIRQRTRAGLEAARARGRVGGRPPSLNAKTIGMARQLLGQPGAKVSDVARALGTSRATLYRSLARATD